MVRKVKKHMKISKTEFIIGINPGRASRKDSFITKVSA